jgi:phosphonopyruvate decarboxylase
MIKAAYFIQKLKKYGFGIFTGVPCSYLKPFINHVINAHDLTYIPAANEGEAVSIASGAELGGRPTLVMFQNSGLGNAVNPLTSLNAISMIPVLIIVTLRGEPGGPKDEPQHRLMGEITGQMLDIMQIPWEYLPEKEEQIDGILKRASKHFSEKNLPFALIMKKGTVEAEPLISEPQIEKSFDIKIEYDTQTVGKPGRNKVLSAIQKASQNKNIIIGSTGFNGRALFAIKDRPNHFYMVGSMGCASSLGLGLSIACPDKKVIVADGDGAFLMRMGALSTIGCERPDNLMHIVLDNNRYESTGGQFTLSSAINIPEIAKSCGYKRVIQSNSLSFLTQTIEEFSALTFFHVQTNTSDDVKSLPRPDIPPADVAKRLRNWIKNN